MSENRTRGIQFGAPRLDRVPDGTGVEPPVPEWVDVAQTLERWFAFVDVCGFTSFTERHGAPAAVCELNMRFARDGFDIHAGIAGGQVLLFEGDDYIGPAANHAARLCDASEPGEVLAFGVGAHLPDWVEVVEERTVDAPGVGRLDGVLHLGVAEAHFAHRAMN